MFEDFGKDMLMLGGTVIGFIAAMLSVMEKLLDFRNRMAPKKERKSPSPTNVRSPTQRLLPQSISFRRSPFAVSPISSCTKPASSSPQACFSITLGSH